MKTTTLALFCSVFSAVSAYSQSEEDIQQWLQPGKHATELMGIKSKVSARQIELSGKVMKAMQKNAAWFRDSAANVTDSTIFYEKTGLTKDEFNEYMIVSDPKSRQPELIKTGDETLVIKRKRSSITFEGTGRLKELAALKFNTVLNSAVYNGKQLEFANRSGGEDANNPFKSPWVGYHYEYEDAGNVLDTGSDLNSMNATKITFDIGYIKNTGKKVLMFSAMKIDGGKPVQTTNLICMIE
jgi:tmRNA-binding protein